MVVVLVSFWGMAYFQGRTVSSGRVPKIDIPIGSMELVYLPTIWSHKNQPFMWLNISSYMDPSWDVLLWKGDRFVEKSLHILEVSKSISIFRGVKVVILFLIRLPPIMVQWKLGVYLRSYLSTTQPFSSDHDGLMMADVSFWLDGWWCCYCLNHVSCKKTLWIYIWAIYSDLSRVTPKWYIV